MMHLTLVKGLKAILILHIMLIVGVILIGTTIDTFIYVVLELLILGGLLVSVSFKEFYDVTTKKLKDRGEPEVYISMTNLGKNYLIGLFIVVIAISIVMALLKINGIV